MRLGHDAYSAICRIHQEPRHRDLCPRMQVDLGLLDIDELPRMRSPEGNHDGQRLRDAEPHVGDADKVSAPPCFGRGMPPDAKLDLSIVDRVSPRSSR